MNQIRLQNTKYVLNIMPFRLTSKRISHATLHVIINYFYIKINFTLYISNVSKSKLNF